MRIGYSRAFGAGAAHRLAASVQRLVTAGCVRVIRDLSPPGTPAPNLDGAVARLEDGHELVVTGLGVFALSQGDLADLLARIAERGGSLVVLDDGITLSGAHACSLVRAILELPALRPPVPGAGPGRPRKITRQTLEMVRKRMATDKLNVVTAAAELGVAPSTLYRALSRRAA